MNRLGNRLRAADWPLDYTNREATADESFSTIFFGGPILTIDDDVPEVEAIAVKDGRIIALGNRKSVFQYHSARTRMVDLQGRALMPGFIDPHVQVAWSAVATYHWVNVSPFAVVGRDQLLSALRSAVSQKKPDEWVLAFGYDPLFSTGDPPLTIEDLDKASTVNPIFVMSQSESAFVNHKALEVVNGARGPRGESTAELRGSPTLAPFLQTFPEITFEENVADCRKLFREWAARGCTTIYDAAVGALWGHEEVRLLLELASEPSTPVRLRAALVPTNDLPHIAGLRPNQGNDRLSFVGIKFTADGLGTDLGGPLSEPLAGSIDDTGLYHDDEELKIQMRGWHADNWQLLVRASGSPAIDQVLRVFGAILADSPCSTHRHRIERCTVINEQQLARAKELGLSISHLIGQVTWSKRFQDLMRGEGQPPRIVPLALDFKYGVRASLHSDSPVTPVDPLKAVQSAVTHMTLDNGDSESDLRTNVDRALKTVTINPAYQCFLDHKVGSIAVGKIADLVILDRNPRAVDVDEIAGIAVLETYLNGVAQLLA